MRALKRLTLLFVVLSLAFAVSCSKNGNYAGEAVDDGGYATKDEAAAYSEGTGGGYYVKDGVDSFIGVVGRDALIYEGKGDGYVDNSVGAGKITASARNDNDYYEDWQKLFVKGQTEEENGKFYDVVNKIDWGFDSACRISVSATCFGDPVAGAKVVYNDGNGNEYSCVTGADGKAYILTRNKKGKINVKSGDYSASQNVDGNDDYNFELNGKEEKANTIRLMFVVDVTGSMGDELQYLNQELKDVIKRVSEIGEIKIDLALLFYRDHEDSEVFAYSDFLDVTDAQNLNLQQSVLAKQRASGGGDLPEAVDEALEMAVNKNWGDDTSTKLIFHVLDAPPHEGQEYSTRYYKAIKTATEKGIRISPVLCSGGDILCEYLVRQAAVYTSGTFIYVTDHSGIGNAHYDPDIPDVTVEKLNDMLVRLIKGYYTGTFEEPVPWKVFYDIDIVEGKDMLEYMSALKAGYGDVVYALVKCDEQTEIKVTVDKEEVEIVRENEKYVRFKFVMPEKNVEVSIETI